MTAPRIIRVLIVDDSSVMRRLLTRLLSGSPGIEVVGAAPDPYVAREMLVAKKPDVMTLDLEMPRMDGLSFLEKVMAHFPTRTLILSGHTPAGSDMARRALELGAVGVVEKPALADSGGIEAIGAQLVLKVRAAAACAMAPKVPTPLSPAASRGLIAIASSTGGTEALKVMLRGLPRNSPGIVIVQHMPPEFTGAYAAHLNAILPFSVSEAKDRDRVEAGRILLAPGDFHMRVERDGADIVVRLDQGPPLHGVRPAADYLLSSAAKVGGKRSIGIVLTGMGRDGAEGLLAMRQAGAFTVVQDEKTSVVWGMPRAAHALGAAAKVAPLGKIAGYVEAAFTKATN